MTRSDEAGPQGESPPPRLPPDPAGSACLSSSPAVKGTEQRCPEAAQTHPSLQPLSLGNTLMSSGVSRKPQRRQGSEGADSPPGMPTAWPSTWTLPASRSCMSDKRPGHAAHPQPAQLVNAQETRRNHKTDWAPPASSEGRKGRVRRPQGAAAPSAEVGGSPGSPGPTQPRRAGGLQPEDSRQTLNSVPNHVPSHQTTGPGHMIQGPGHQFHVHPLLCNPPSPAEPAWLLEAPWAPLASAFSLPFPIIPAKISIKVWETAAWSPTPNTGLPTHTFKRPMEPSVHRPQEPFSSFPDSQLELPRLSVAGPSGARTGSQEGSSLENGSLGHLGDCRRAGLRAEREALVGTQNRLFPDQPQTRAG